MKKPSERIQELCCGNNDWMSLIAAITLYLDEQAEKKSIFDHIADAKEMVQPAPPSANKHGFKCDLCGHDNKFPKDVTVYGRNMTDILNVINFAKQHGYGASHE